MKIPVQALNHCLFFSSVLILFSCGSGQKDNVAGAENDSLPADTTAVRKENKEFSQVPSPDEMFSFIKQIGNKSKNPSLLNPVGNVSKYVDNRSKALNFGIYAADLLYCSNFEVSSDIAKYFATVKKLGDEIGISTAISEQTAKRISDNLSNADSLGLITNEVYYSAFDNLEANNRGNVLALVLAGGWIEGLHVAGGSVKKFEAGNPVVERIMDQKFTLENLLEFMKKYESDPDVSKTMAELSELNTLFGQLKSEEGPAIKITTKKGKRVLSGGGKSTLTEENYKAILEKTKSIRNAFTQSN